jgi:uncharacterized membrane protein YphA (DoxX/SURF4 family)
MRGIVTVARVLLGLVFVVFGLNGFLHFLPMPPMSATAGAFFGGLAAAGYFLPLLFLTQVVGGLLLLSGMFVPLALALLAPVILNIFLFHVFVEPSGLPLAIVVSLLELFLVWAHRDAFAPMLRPRIEG